MNRGRLLRLYTMIAAVSSVSLFVFSSLFTNTLLAIAVVAVAVVAFVSVVLGFLLAGVEYFDEPPEARTTDVSSTRSGTADQ